MLPSASLRTAEDVAAAPPRAAHNEVNALSVSELRAGMQQFLRSSGALGSLKTQLRSVIVSELLKRKGPAAKPATARQAADDEEGDVEEEDELWTQRVADALVESHLRHTGRSFSLSIFSTEADVSFGSSGDDALAALLHLDTSVTAQRRTSLLQSILEMYLRHVGDPRGQPQGYTIGTQTDINETEMTPPPLELRLAAVDAKYALSTSRLRESTREEVERRMAAYREELQLQMEQGYQQRLRTFEQQQLHEAQQAAESHYGVLLQHKMEEMREMERVSVQRIEAERTRLGQARGDLELQRVELERRQRDLQGLLEERDKAVAAVEGRLHEAKQQIRVLTTQVRQYEELCGVRLAETDAARDREWRRVEDMRRLQAEHLAELQLKDEEIGRLRFRLKSILAAHGITNWRDELGERERADTIREALATANAFQERVSAAAYMPSQHRPPSQEAAWHSAWQPNASSELRDTTTNNVDREPFSTEPHPVPQSTTSVIRSPPEQQQQQQHEEDVKGFPTLNSPPTKTFVAATTNITATSPDPAKIVTDSVSAHQQPLIPGAVPQGALEGKTFDGEDQRKDEEHIRKDDTFHSGGKAVTDASERPPPPSSYSSSQPQSRQTPSGGSSVSENLAPQSSTNSSFSEDSSSSKPEQESKQTAITTAADPQLKKEKEDALHRDEATGRESIESDEDKERRAIEWSAKSQHTVLLQRQAAEKKEKDAFGAGRGTSSLDAYVAQARQRQQATENIVFSSDSADEIGNDLLFRRRGSSDESF